MNTNAMERTQQYNLKWTDFTSNMLEKFADHLNREALTDISLVCEGTVIHAHRIILSASSTYFQNLFELYRVPSPMIIFNGVKLEDLQQVLAFIYQGEIKVDEESIQRILKLATDFGIKGLSNISYGTILEQKQHKILNETAPPKIVSATTIHNNNQEDIRSDSEGTNNTPAFRLSTIENEMKDYTPHSKIVRPPNAFMLFTTEWRTKLAEKYPDDNNKEISVRLGTMWKKLPPQQKTKYYSMARKLENGKEIKDYRKVEARRKDKRHKHQEENRVDVKQETEDSSGDSSSDKLEIVDEVELIEVDKEVEAPNKKNGIEDKKL